MALIPTIRQGSAGRGAAASEQSAAPFELFGNGVSFAPFFYPQRVVVGKEHNLSREETPCATEDVTNTGPKNREIHITGLIRHQEKLSLEAVMDQTEEMNLISLSWSGEVVVENVEYEGPVGWDAHTREFHFQYTMDLVSTGADEAHSHPPDGIIREAGGSGGGNAQVQ